MADPVRSKLHVDFQCQCYACDETMENATEVDPRVIISRCGCIFLRSHLGNYLLPKLTENIHHWFDGENEGVCRFNCPSKHNIIGSRFSFSDMIVDPTHRYLEVWQRAQESLKEEQFSVLTGNENFSTRNIALIPIPLAEILAAIEKEQKELKWEGKDWSTFQGELNNLRHDYRQGNLGENRERFFRYINIETEQIQQWEQQKNLCLKESGLGIPQTEWGILRTLWFGVRAVYHGSMAVILEYGLWFAKYQNIIGKDRYEMSREGNVGDRLARLFLEYYGIEYNRSEMPPKSFEYCLWN